MSELVLTPATMSDWMIFVIILFSLSQLLLLVFVMTLALKLNKLVSRIDDVSRDAGKFVRMGMSFFKGQRKI